MIIVGALPRTGSTLITNLLNQNPEFHVSNTSPLPDLFLGMQRAYQNSDNIKASLDYEAQREQLFSAMRGMAEGWGGEGYIDKSRAWLPQVDLLDKVFGKDWKIIAPIRSLEGIVESFEAQSKAYPELVTEAPINDVARAEYFLNQPFFGQALEATKKAIVLGLPDNILWIPYEQFTLNPQEMFRAIYKFLGKEYYNHDFKTIKQTLSEHDPIHLPYGDHSIITGGVREYTTPKVSEEVRQYLRGRYPWYYETFYNT